MLGRSFPQIGLSICEDFSLKRAFSKKVFEMVFIYPFKKKPTLLDWEIQVEKLEGELYEILLSLVGPNVDLSLFKGGFRVLGYFLWVHNRLFNNIKNLEEKCSLMSALLPKLSASETAIQLTKIQIKTEYSLFAKPQKVGYPTLFTCAELVRLITAQRELTINNRIEPIKQLEKSNSSSNNKS